MKKVLLIVVLAIAGVANAQKGTVLVAGELGFSSKSKLSNYSESNFAFSPRVGYQFNDHMTVGLDLGFQNNTTQSTSNSNSEVKTDVTMIGAFLRYAKPLAGVFSIYGDLAVGSASAKVSYGTGGSGKSNGMYLGLTPAVGVDLKKGFCLNFSFGGLMYQSAKADAAGAETATQLDFNLGKQVNIGVSKNF